MEKYRLIKEVGRGSYGDVWHAINLYNCKDVAIKKLKTNYYDHDHSSAKKEIMREVKSLKKMNNHPYIVKLLEAIRENNTMFLVFEYMQGSLYNRMVSRCQQQKPFSETEIRNMCFQIFQGIAYMHHNGYFHRDLKPGNLLVFNDVIKIGDLGSVREMGDHSPYTYRVGTSWYRAPEVFLRAPCYNSAVDMWAMGAIMVELFTFRPLFKCNSKADVMWKICSVLGTPTDSTWFSGLNHARKMCYQFPELPGVRLADLLPSSASLDAVNLIGSLLSWNPFTRPTAMEVLQHPFFDDCYRVSPTIGFKDTTSDSIMIKMMMQRHFELLMQSPKSSLESWMNCSERAGDLSEDDQIIRMLPECPFEFMN